MPSDGGEARMGGEDPDILCAGTAGLSGFRRGASARFAGDAGDADGRVSPDRELYRWGPW